MLFINRRECRAGGANARRVVHDLVATPVAFDEREAAHQKETLAWVRSGAPLFRVAKPATPDRHLCVYFALFAEGPKPRVLLVDHVKAGLWLLPGGHVDPEEDPRVTVLREAGEELRIRAEFHPRFGSDPLFVTVAETRGADSHVDVSLWFVLRGDDGMDVSVDPREARGARWFALDEPAEWVGDRFDPHMRRFRDTLLATTGPAAMAAVCESPGFRVG
jgi:8-oxo-dGTP diphosphatase